MITIDLKSLIEKFSPTVKNALEGAAGLCMSRGHFNVEVEHWLIKLLEDKDSDFIALIERYEIAPSDVQSRLNALIEKFKTGATRPPALSTSVVETAKTAWMLASVDYGMRSITSAHVLGAILLDDQLRQQINASQVFSEIAPESLRDMVRAIVGTTAESEYKPSESDGSQDAPQDPGMPSKTPSLDKYTINLTQKARQGSIDPVLGRDGEVRQVIDILTRRRQNNPILTGEAGVGKTAVVEGFALRIAQDDVPTPLKGVEIYSLDLGLLQAGASVKGEFENRLKSVISEVKSSPKPIIMFIDEAHTMIGAGGKEGQGDAANLLKPALARGEMRTIAATTWAEYKKYFKRDPALTRRFQVVKVEEPSESVAIDMMRGIAESLASHHKVKILDEAIQASVQLSSRYIMGRQLPDKSVSLLDTACARVALSHSATPAILEDLHRREAQLTNNLHRLEKEHATQGQQESELIIIKTELDDTQKQLVSFNQQWEKEKSLIDSIRDKHSVLEENFILTQKQMDGHIALSDTDKKALQEELSALHDQLEELQADTPLMQPHVDSQAVAEVVANWTGIPVGKMVADEINTVLSLQEQMEERVIGQSHALEAIAQAIQTSRAGLTDPRKPIGVFMMVGPSGTGKTETALTLAELLYGGSQNVTTINMSEFKEEHKVSMLLGSPPGYVGYGEGGVLTEAVRRNPYSVILLDEMEKAHPGVQDIFYNLFDKGTIKDGEGRDIDFKNTIIIMTSNAGEAAIRQICASQEELPDPQVLFDSFRPELLKHFKPAFLGRASVIPYYPLGDEQLLNICKISLDRVKKRAQNFYNAELSYDENVPLHIVARCYDVDTGARNIENILTKTLLPELATACLGYMAEGLEIQSIHIQCSEEGEFSYSIETQDKKEQ